MGCLEGQERSRRDGEEKMNNDEILENFRNMKKDDGWKKKIIDILIIILLFFVVVGLGYVSYQLYIDSGKCIGDPIGYYNSLGDDNCTIYCSSGTYGNEIFEYGPQE